jgi:P2-related tail formation protein
VKLDGLELIKLIPAFMRGGEAVTALAVALNPVIREAASRVKLLKTWDQLDYFSEAELDALAWELNVLWYSLSADIAVKRRLIRQSDLVYSRLGTKWAVEQIIGAYLGGDERLDIESQPVKEPFVKEFFEYGGEPFYFRLDVSFDGSISKETWSDMYRAIMFCKNLRSWLEGVTIRSRNENELFVGSVNVSDTGRWHIPPKTLSSHYVTSEIFYATGTVEYTRIILPVKAIA